MHTLLLLAVAGATSVSLAEPDFTTVDVPAAVARSCAEQLAAELSARGARVVTQQEIAQRLGPERQRELLGCSGAATSCAAKLSSALGTDAVLLGDLGRVEKGYQLDLRVVRSGTGQLVTALTAPIDSEDDLRPALTRAAERLAPELFEKLAPSPAAAVSAQGATLEHRWPVGWTVGATALVVAGAVLDMIAAAAYEQLLVPTETPLTSAREADGVKLRGQLTMVASWVSYGLAAGALAWSTVLYLRGEPPRVQPAVLIFPGGGALGVAGVFP